MMKSFHRIIAIAKNTFRETLRDRILWAAVVVSLLLIAIALFAGSVSLGQDRRMLVNFGLTAIYILQVFVAVFVGSMLIWKEVERRSFFLVIPKPVRREEVIIGKCIGLFVTTVSVTLISLSVLLALLALRGATAFIIPILVATAYSLLEVVLLILLSMLFSGLTSPILSAVYTSAFYLIGHSGAILRELIGRLTDTFGAYPLTIAYYIFPNLEKFNIRNDVVFGTLPEPRLVATTLLYAVIYALVLFLLARAMFLRKEF